jgi:PAS domain S-box-containing protein
MKKNICPKTKNRRNKGKLTLKRADLTASLQNNFEGNSVPPKTVKRKLAQSKIELQTFFNQAPDLLCIIQPDGTLGQLNTAWKSLLGWTPEALQSHPWIELVHPEDVEASQKAMQQAREDQNCYINNRYHHKDNSYRYLSWSLCRSGDGYWYAVGREVIAHQQGDTTPEEQVKDITDVYDELRLRKQAELTLQERTKALQEAHQRLMLHIENSPLAVLEWDSAGKQKKNYNDSMKNYYTPIVT